MQYINTVQSDQKCQTNQTWSICCSLVTGPPQSFFFFSLSLSSEGSRSVHFVASTTPYSVQTALASFGLRLRSRLSMKQFMEETRGKESGRSGELWQIFHSGSSIQSRTVKSAHTACGQGVLLGLSSLQLKAYISSARGGSPCAIRPFRRKIKRIIFASFGSFFGPRKCLSPAGFSFLGEKGVGKNVPCASQAMGESVWKVNF